MRKAVLAAFIAITVNTILLKAANMLAVRAESGGLLKLALSALPSAIHRPAFLKSAIFWFFFHYMIGFAMAGCYFFLFRNRLPRPGIVRGSLFSIFPWILNSFVVLPLLGQGPIGLFVLPISGIAYFFVSNLVFGMLLGGLYERWNDAHR